MFLLTETTTPQTASAWVSTLGELATSFTDTLLSIGTKIFNWAMNNPFYLIGILVMIIFIVIAIVKSFGHR